MPINCSLPPCSLLYRGEGQVKYCRVILSVLSFHSFLLAALSPSSSAHLIMLLTNLPVRLHCMPTSFLRSFFLLLFTLFVLVIRRTQLFSHTCSFCCCCCSVNATVSRLYRQYLHKKPSFYKQTCEYSCSKTLMSRNMNLLNSHFTI